MAKKKKKRKITEHPDYVYIEGYGEITFNRKLFNKIKRKARKIIPKKAKNMRRYFRGAQILVPGGYFDVGLKKWVRTYGALRSGAFRS